MKTLLSIVVIVIVSQFTSAQWIKQDFTPKTDLRGLSVVTENIVWASGTRGTVIKTTDHGGNWDTIVVPGAEGLDFRDIEAFDANTAYILSIGNGESSRIYKTTDGGATWKEQFRNKNEKAFYDAMACWDRNNCIAMSDPVDGKFVLINTKDGGANWRAMDTDKMPSAKEGEAAFAASGTCLITQGKNNVFLVTGGNAARVFRSNNRGLTWFVADTPIVKGTQGSGIFSIAMRDSKNGVIVGGNYEKPAEAENNLAFTTDGGTTWKRGTGITGYRSALAYLSAQMLVAVGSHGSDLSMDGGKAWRRLGIIGSGIDSSTSAPPPSLNAVMSSGEYVWGVGANGLVAKYSDRSKRVFRVTR